MTYYNNNSSRPGAEPNVETFLDGSGWHYRWLTVTPTGPFKTEADAVAHFTKDLPWSWYRKGMWRGTLLGLLIGLFIGAMYTVPDPPTWWPVHTDVVQQYHQCEAKANAVACMTLAGWEIDGKCSKFKDASLSEDEMVRACFHQKGGK